LHHSHYLGNYIQENGVKYIEDVLKTNNSLTTLKYDERYMHCGGIRARCNWETKQKLQRIFLLVMHKDDNQKEEDYNSLIFDIKQLVFQKLIYLSYLACEERKK
jgi:hypothetical protein